MPPNKLKYWRALSRAPNIGSAAIGKLLSRLQTPEAIVKAGKKTLTHFGVPQPATDAITQPDWKAIDKECEWADGQNQHILTLNEPYYPALLKQISSPPAVLYIKGSLECLSWPQLAIVGSHNPTPIGTELAYQYAQTLAQKGLCITSGLAIGIDTFQHGLWGVSC